MEQNLIIQPNELLTKETPVLSPHGSGDRAQLAFSDDRSAPPVPSWTLLYFSESQISPLIKGEALLLLRQHVLDFCPIVST